MKLWGMCSVLIMWVTSLLGVGLPEVVQHFPEFGLSEATTVTVRRATDVTTLKAALSAAQSTVGDDLILLQATSEANQVWTGSTSIAIGSTSNNGKIIIVAMADDGSLTHPITFKGFSLYTCMGNVLPIYLANVSIREVTTLASDQRGVMIANGSGALTLSRVTIADSGTTSCLGGLVAYGPTLRAYNTTVHNCTFFTGMGAGVCAYIGQIDLVYCTITQNGTKDVGRLSGTVTATNSIFSTGSATSFTTVTQSLYSDAGLGELQWSDATCVGHRAYLSGAATGVAGATPIATVLQDALGNTRDTSHPDCGAVEFVGVLEMTAPEDFIALPSGMKQVYLGWSECEVASKIQIQYRSTLEEAWQTIPAQEYVLSSTANAYGWRSARHIHLTPGTSYRYRVGFWNEESQMWVYTAEAVATTVAANAVPSFSSRPQATKTIFLDFSTYVFEDLLASIRRGNTAFKDAKYAVLPNYVHYGYDVGGGTSISTAAAIEKIWKMVAEDWAIFDINVTTVEPEYEDLVKTETSDERYGMRVLVGQLGTRMTADAAMSELVQWGSTGESTFNTFSSSEDHVVIVSGNVWLYQNAMTASHEVGHTFALVHDSATSAQGTTEYYTGQNVVVNEKELFTQWYPIMGATQSGLSSQGKFFDCYDVMNQWSRGDYTNATDAYKSVNGVPEDDIAVIIGLWKDKCYYSSETVRYGDHGVRLIADTVGDTCATAAVIPQTAWQAQQVRVSELIGKHTDEARATVLEDVDVYAFAVTAAGTLSARVYTDDQQDGTGSYTGVSLNAGLEILDSTGAVLATARVPLHLSAQGSSSNNFRDAEVSQVVLPKAGTYYARVLGVGDTATSGNDASAYGSIGKYALALTLEQTEPETPSTLLLETTAWHPSDLPATTTVALTARTAWTATCSAEWLTCTPTVGTTGATTLTLCAEANPTRWTRTATVTLTAEDSTSETVNVTQDGRTSGFSLSIR